MFRLRHARSERVVKNYVATNRFDSRVVRHARRLREPHRGSCFDVDCTPGQFTSSNTIAIAGPTVRIWNCEMVRTAIFSPARSVYGPVV